MSLLAVTGTTVVASGTDLLVDNGSGNGIARGDAQSAIGPNQAIVYVTNMQGFWAAIEPTEVGWGSLMLTPSGVFAEAAVIAPGATTEYIATWDQRDGGGRAIRIHYDGTSIGGLSAVALNVVQVVAFGLGAGKLTGSAEAVQAAAKAITDLPDWVRVVHDSTGDAASLSDVRPVVKLLVGTSAGRAAIISALSELGITGITEGSLAALTTGMAGAEVLALVADLVLAVRAGTTDGSVFFYAWGTPGPSPSAVPAPTPATDSWETTVRVTADAEEGVLGMHATLDTLVSLQATGEWCYMNGANAAGTGIDPGCSGPAGVPGRLDPNAVLNNYPVGGLMARVGFEDWFYVGSQYADIFVPEDSSLVLGFNDTPDYRDNNGSVEVVLTLSEPSPTPGQQGQVTGLRGVYRNQDCSRSRFCRGTMSNFRAFEFLSDYDVDLISSGGGASRLATTYFVEGDRVTIEIGRSSVFLVDDSGCLDAGGGTKLCP